MNNSYRLQTFISIKLQEVMKLLSDVLSHVSKRSFKVAALPSWRWFQNGCLANPTWEIAGFLIFLIMKCTKSQFNPLAYTFVSSVVMQTSLMVFGFTLSCSCTTDRCSVANEWAGAAKSRYAELVGGGHSFNSGITLSWRWKIIMYDSYAYRTVG